MRTVLPLVFPVGFREATEGLSRLIRQARHALRTLPRRMTLVDLLTRLWMRPRPTARGRCAHGEAPSPDLTAAFRSIGIDKHYDELDLSGLEEDLQGWGSNAEIFEEVIRDFRPDVPEATSFVELGSLPPTRCVDGPTMLTCRRCLP